MKLALARSLFFVGSLAIASLAAVVWREPIPGIINAQNTMDHHSLSLNVKSYNDIQVLLILLFGLSQDY